MRLARPELFNAKAFRSSFRRFASSTGSTVVASTFFTGTAFSVLPLLPLLLLPVVVGRARLPLVLPAVPTAEVEVEVESNALPLGAVGATLVSAVLDVVAAAAVGGGGEDRAVVVAGR